MTRMSAIGKERASGFFRRKDGDAAEEADAQVFTARYAPGDRPLAVVLLPALFVGDWMWEPIHQRLSADGWPVVQFTESISLTDKQTARSINRIAARLLEGVRQHTSLPLVVAGDSLGGLIAFEFARSFADETAGLVVSGAPGLNLKVNSLAKEIAQEATTAEEFADKFMAKLLYDPGAHDIDRERYRAVVNELAQPENLTSMLSAVRAINRYNSRKVVMSVDTPKLFIWGKQDLITPLAEWEAAVPQMRNARIVSFDQCGHGPMFEKPDDFYREMSAFLRELAGLPAPEAAAPQAGQA